MVVGPGSPQGYGRGMETSPSEAPVMCARHPGRPALTVCARCGRPMCAEDLIAAPVGYQCVDCARSGPTVRRLGDPAQGISATGVMVALIGIAALLNAVGAIDARTYGLVPVAVGLGDWWRLISSAFLHGGIVHLAFNGLLLWRLGSLLERAIGPGPLIGLAASGTAGGGLGVIELAWLAAATPLSAVPAVGWFLGAGPLSVTVGASGAVFGLMGAVLVMFRRRGMDPWATTEGSAVGALVLLNLVLTFAVPSISVGGHVGGLLGGGAAAMLVGGRGGRLDRRRRGRETVQTIGFAILLLTAATLVARDLVRVLLS